MSKTLHIIASGASPQLAGAIQGGIFSQGGLTAAGTTKATALALSSADSYVSICSSGKGVALPGDLFQGDTAKVFNGGANALLVYSTIGTSDIINNQSANGGFTISTFKSAYFTKVSSTLYIVNYSK